MASWDPTFYMNCFILPARMREDRTLAFSRKCPATLIGQAQQANLPKVVEFQSQKLVDPFSR